MVNGYTANARKIKRKALNLATSFVWERCVDYKRHSGIIIWFYNFYLGNRSHASGKSRNKINTSIKFRECEEQLNGKRLLLQTNGRIYRSCNTIGDNIWETLWQRKNEGAIVVLI